MRCPRCTTPLRRDRGQRGITWHCEQCGGHAATMALLRRKVARDRLLGLWRTLAEDRARVGPGCPACTRAMAAVDVELSRPDADDRTVAIELDVCRPCTIVWLDGAELEALQLSDPSRQATAPQKEPLSLRAREALAKYQIDQIRQRADEDIDATPDSWWSMIPAAFGLPVETRGSVQQKLPWVVLGLVLAIVCVFAAQVANGGWSDLAFIEAFGFIPAEPMRYGGLTFLTAFFLHGSIGHVLGNLWFLWVFGDDSEDRLGSAKFLGLIVAATVAGNLAHLVFHPGSEIPCVGASGGISGVLAFYVLSFPKRRFSLLLRAGMFLRMVALPAWFWGLMWLALQVFGGVAGSGNVAVMAHLGGAAVGAAAWGYLRARTAAGWEPVNHAG